MLQIYRADSARGRGGGSWPAPTTRQHFPSMLCSHPGPAWPRRGKSLSSRREGAPLVVDADASLLADSGVALVLIATQVLGG